MSESKDNLDRLREKGDGHRRVCVKLVKEAGEILSLDEVDANWCEVIISILEVKLKTLNEIEEEILGLCDVTDIE